MSYTRNIISSVSGSRTVSVSYPASERGGSTSVTVEVDIPVTIALTVDTSGFDRSIANFGGRANLLTGAVVATQAAHVASIAGNAAKVADNILKGFFGVIQSEISQQILEYRTRCEALLLTLNDMKTACLGKKSLMQKDYARIAERFAAVFEDLDQELANRIHAVDVAAFSLREAANAQVVRSTATSASTLPTIYAGEESHGRASLGLGSLRRNALKLIYSAREYMAGDRQVSQSLGSILSGGEHSSHRDKHVPILFAEMDGLDGAAKQEALVADTATLAALDTRGVQDHLTRSFRESRRTWAPMDDNTSARIGPILNRQIAAMTVGDGAYESRLAATMIQLWRTNRPATLQSSDHLGQR